MNITPRKHGCKKTITTQDPKDYKSENGIGYFFWGSDKHFPMSFKIIHFEYFNKNLIRKARYGLKLPVTAAFKSIIKAIHQIAPPIYGDFLRFFYLPRVFCNIHSIKISHYVKIHHILKHVNRKNLNPNIIKFSMLLDLQALNKNKNELKLT